jgi:hypothetical protein
MTTPRVGRNLLATSLIVSVLTACGGGGGGGSSPTPPPPSGSNPTPTPPAPPPSPSPPANTPVPAPGAGVTSGNTYGVTSTGRLVTFDREDPALDTAIAITGMQSGETALGIDIRAGGSTPGQLYALGSTGRIYTVDTTTGVATQKSQLAADSSDTSDPFTALSGTEYGVDFDDVTDRLRVVSDNGQNLRIDVDSGATITDAALTSGGASRAGINGAAYTNAFADACRSKAYFIDSTTDELLTTSDANGGALTVVGPLGVDASAVSDFEIATAADGTNTGYAVLVVSGAPTSYQIDLSNGTAASAGPITRLDDNEVVRDTAIAPPATAPTQDPGDVFALTEGNKLLSINSAAPAKVCTSASFSGQQADEKIVGIDVRPADQQMYALGSTGRLYTVDKSSGALTQKSTLVAALGDVTAPYAGLSGTTFGFDWNPGNDLIRIVSDTGLNFRVTPDDGVVTTDSALNPAGSTPGEAAYSNNFAGVLTASYYVIDSASDSLQVVGRSSGNTINGDVTTIGSLGVGDVQAVAGFDILGTDNRGLAALNTAGNSSSDLYSVNLQTGAATRLATIGGGERVSGLAYAKTSVAEVFALTADNHLVSFKATTPGTLDSDVAITGLDGSEAIVGIDFRPSNGQLYALTNAGRLYTLDTATGAASGGVTLSANTLDSTSPYSGLTGTRFGIDFGSADDQLRVQSDAGQNLRVNLADNTVITDGTPNIGGTPAQLFATAFNNPYAGATTSVHYALDMASNSLVRQTSISGALTSVGTLTVGGTPGSFQLEGGFDIAGGENGLAVVALLPTGATQSTLYRMSLGNGALTSMGTVGSSAAIRDIAVQLL